MIGVRSSVIPKGLMWFWLAWQLFLNLKFFLNSLIILLFIFLEIINHSSLYSTKPWRDVNSRGYPVSVIQQELQSQPPLVSRDDVK